MGKDKINLLFVDDEEAILDSLKKRLEVRGFDVVTASRGDKAVELARTTPIDIALVDLKMPGMRGEEVLTLLKKEHPWMEVVILTGHGSIDSAVECTKGGAYFYLQKPCELDRMLDVLVQAYRKKILNKTQMKEERLAEILKMAESDSPLALLRRLKELDSGNP